MFIHNVVFYYYRAKFCVRQILPVTHPRFSSPMQHNRDNIYLPKKGSIAIQTAPLLPPLLSMLYIFANVHWVLIKKVSEYVHLCLMLQTYTSVVKKTTITLPRMPSKVDMPYKTFFRNTGQHYSIYH